MGRDNGHKLWKIRKMVHMEYVYLLRICCINKASIVSLCLLLECLRCSQDLMARAVSVCLFLSPFRKDCMLACMYCIYWTGYQFTTKNKS